MGKNRKNGSGELAQILLNVIIIGLFTIAENWLLFYYECSWVLPTIFGVLILLMSCLLAINVYRCVARMTGTKSTDGDMQMQALLYKQMKKMDANHEQNLNELNQLLEQKLEELKMNQLRSTKALLSKVESDAGVEGFAVTQEQWQELQAKLEQLQQTLDEMKQMSNAPISPAVAEEERVFEMVPEEAVEESIEESVFEDLMPEEPIFEDLMPEEPVEEAEESEEEQIAEVAEEPVFEDLMPEEPVEEAEESEEEQIAEVAEEPIFEDLLPEEPVSEETEESAQNEETLAGFQMDDPNRQLTPDEIAALFSGIN